VFDKSLRTRATAQAQRVAGGCVGRGPGVAPPCVGETAACVATESLKATNFHKPKQIRRRNNNNHNQIIIISSSLVPTKKKGNRTFTNVKKVKKVL